MLNQLHWLTPLLISQSTSVQVSQSLVIACLASVSFALIYDAPQPPLTILASPYASSGNASAPQVYDVVLKF